MVQVKRIGSNMTEVETSKAIVLFSYATPVAAFFPGKGYIKTESYYSKTTSGHITKWLQAQVGNNGMPEVETVPQHVISGLVG